MRIATVSLVRAPLDKLTEWVAYHVNVGVDEMYLFFDDPADPAVSALMGHPQIHCIPCDEAFWATHRAPGLRTPAVFVPDKQAAMLAYLLRRDDLTVDWLAHIDSDELIWSPSGVRGSLERELHGDVDHLQMPPLEAVVPRLRMADAFREVSLFKEHRKSRYALARTLGVRRPFRNGVYLRGHRQGKAIVRVGRFTTMRVHGPMPVAISSTGAVSEVASDLRVLHYDAGNFAEWLAKWNNREVFAGRLSRARKRQTRRFRRVRDSRPGGGRARLKRLYRREYMLTERDARILRSLGLLRKITIDEQLFTLPPAMREPA